MDDLITHLRTKAEAKKKPKNVLVAESGVTLNLNMEAWDKWVAFRKLAKFAKYKTDATMLKLSKMGSYKDQMQIVQNSIDAQYQGLFALKGNNNGSTKSTSQKLSANERVKARNDAKYRTATNECGLGMGANDGHMGRAVDEGKRGATIEHVDNEPFIDY